MSDLQPFLDKLCSHSSLTDEEQEAILKLPRRVERVPANRDFIRQGEAVSHACMVVAGIVGRFCQDPNGVRQLTMFHIPGDMPDLHSVVQPQAASGLQALTQAIILRVPHADIRAVAAKYPALAEAFWRECVIDAAVLAQWVMNVGSRDGRSRIAHLLCEMACRVGLAAVGHDAVFPFGITQAQLGEATGLSMVHVNRVLKSLRNDGIVEFRDKVVRVDDWDRLQAVAQFEAAYLQLNIPPKQRLRIVPTGPQP